jgi:hypothetical protein
MVSTFSLSGSNLPGIPLECYPSVLHDQKSHTTHAIDVQYTAQSRNHALFTTIPPLDTLRTGKTGPVQKRY